MKPTNKALADRLRDAFEKSFSDGEKMVWENLECITQDPDVLSESLNKILNFDGEKDRSFFEQLISASKSRNIYLYLYLPLLIPCVDMHMTKNLPFINKWMKTCCEMDKKPIFRVYELFLQSAWRSKKRFCRASADPWNIWLNRMFRQINCMHIKFFTTLRNLCGSAAQLIPQMHW